MFGLLPRRLRTRDFSPISCRRRVLRLAFSIIDPLHTLTRILRRAGARAGALHALCGSFQRNPGRGT